MSIIVVSLADSIYRHPDVTLESGLVRHTFVDLYPRFNYRKIKLTLFGAVLLSACEVYA